MGKTQKKDRFPSGGDVIKLVLRNPPLLFTEPGQYCFLRIGEPGWFEWHAAATGHEVRKRVSFAPFYNAKNDDFTKTGSGQT